MSEPSPYQGLNLPDLLERMHDLVLPEPVAWLPQTDGWWLAAAWLIGLLVLAARRGLIQRRNNRYRREALASLAAMAQSGGGGSAAGVAELVKRTALSAYPRSQVAGLYGEQWASFLIRTGREDRVIESAAARLASAAYEPGVELEEVVPCAERWIRRHRA